MAKQQKKSAASIKPSVRGKKNCGPRKQGAPKEESVVRGRSLKQALQAELAGHAPTRGSIASSRGVPSLLAAVQAVARRTSGGAPSTDTVSSTLPTASTALMTGVAPTCSTMPVRS